MTKRRIVCERSRNAALEWFTLCMANPPAPTQAYPVPWAHVHDGADSEAQRIVRNMSADVLIQVRAWRCCRCGLQSSLPERVLPGDLLRIRAHTCGQASCGHGEWYLRWFAGDGRELVWPFVW